MTGNTYSSRHRWQTLWFAGLLLCAQLLVALHALEPGHDGMADNCEVCLVGHQLSQASVPDLLLVPVVPARISVQSPVISPLPVSGTTTPCQRGPPGHLRTA